jgi:amino acid adenylation domain-containing protein
MNPGTSTYNVPIAWRLHGDLNLAVLRSSFEALARRHEVLRTAVSVVGGQPVQRVSSEPDVPVPVIDLSTCHGDEREMRAQRRIHDEATVPFDLSTGPLIRASVLRLAPDEHILIVILHHIVTDGWSRKILVRELSALYAAFSQRHSDPLPPLPLQYGDFALWQRAALEGEALQRQLAYWRPKLAGAPQLLELPADRARPAVQSYEGARRLTSLPTELSERLNALSATCNTTLFMTLYAAFLVLLYRYSGQEDLVVGTPIANRTRPEVEDLIGFFTNTLALRTNMSGNPSFKELLGRARETALEAYAHQEMPFEKLVEELKPERNPAHSPIFQVMFMLQNPWEAGLELSGLLVETIEIDRWVGRFDLSLSIAQRPQGLETCLEYNTDLFDEARMERLLGHYRTLLEGIVADPGQSIARLPLLTTPECRRLLVELNATADDVPHDECIHHLFEQQAQRTPSAMAVEHHGRTLTYARLNAEANRLARDLRERGVRPEDRVALCSERSLEMAVGVLGILKVGAAYVPIDPSYPAQRVALMCRDAGVTLVLTHGNVHEALAEMTATCLPLTQDRLRFSSDNLEGDLSSQASAYVIYTSGSTGRPKGVTMIHAALVNLLYWQKRVLPRSRRTLQFASIGFDVSFQEIFTTWFCGGTLVMVDEDERRDTPALLRLLDTLKVERLFVPFAVLQNLAIVSRGESVTPSALCEIITAGEQLQMTPEIIALLQRLPGVVLQNHYGPTETHVVSASIMEGDPGDWPSLPPIGTPITDTQTFLLDAGWQLVPEGVPGELFLAGACLARGYLHRPDATAERFVPDPFSGVPGARMYRTGDLARYLPDGNLEYLGRIDHQVKIRGFRVELGEIENALLQHPQVREAVTLVREESPGDKRLVAYVVRTDEDLSVGMLRERLRETLPGHMVPSAFVMLEKLPLNSNGKVDRKALPAPDATAYERGAGYVPPRTEREEILTEIWGQALRVERVGIYDHFFELGGHSLLATQVVARIREVFQAELPLRTLFDNPTIAALASHPALAARDASILPDPPLCRADRDRPLPVSFAQERLWFMDQLQPGSSQLNFPMALRLIGRLDVEALQRALMALERRQEVLRTLFRVHHSDPIQIVVDCQEAPVTVVALETMPTDRQQEAIERLVAQEVRRPFDLAHGPIYRCRLIRVAPEDHVLVLTLHHIAADETSATVLLSELSALYQAEVKGRPAELPELPVQYADYSVWQRERFRMGRFQSQMDYWKQKLRGAPSFLEIPTDMPRPSAPTFSRQSHRFTIARETLDRVTTLCRAETVTPFMFFLAAFQLLLGRWTGRQDILVGTDALNRDRPETERLIGFFINQLVLRTDLSGCASFRELLRRVRGVALEGYAHQELPFNKLVEALRPARDPERPPLYQVKLAYTRGGAAETPQLDGLSVSWLPTDKGAAQLDVTLFLREHPEGMVGRMEYRDELYRPTTIARLVHDFTELVQSCASDPDGPFELKQPNVVEDAPKTDAKERLLANRTKLLKASSAGR